MENYNAVRTKYKKKIKAISPEFDLIFLNDAHSPNFRYLRAYFREMKKLFSLKGELSDLKSISLILGRNFRGLNRESWIFITDRAKPIACLNYDLIAVNKKIYCGLIIYLSVKTKYRRRGFARLLLNLLDEIAEAEAKRRRLKLFGYFIETNDPGKMTSSEIKLDGRMSGIKTKERLLIWQKLQFKKLNFRYTQPSFGSGPATYLSLIFRPKQTKRYLKSAVLIEYLKEFTAFTISDKKQAARDEDLKAMINELEEKKEIALVDIIP